MKTSGNIRVGNDMLTLLIIALFTLLLTSGHSPVWAGNKEMVEKEVQDLDHLNKEALKNIPDIPEDGRIEIKADVTYEKDSPLFHIYEKNIISEKEENIKFDDKRK